MKYSNRRSCNNAGFTIIEIFVIIAIIFILAAVVFPRFVNFENQARLSTVKENMKIVQMAVNAYAINNKGQYPDKPDDPGFRSYFPGGNCDLQNPKGGNYPENPFTHKAEAPMLGNIGNVEAARKEPPPNLGGPRMAGKIFYNPIIFDGTPKEPTAHYAIEGTDGNGMAISDPRSGTTYVLSNL